MTDQLINRNVIRIPNLPTGRIVDENGKATDEEQMFRQGLLLLLQRFLGDEGMVMPSQSAANISAIQTNIAEAPGATPDTTYTCQFGTLIYQPSTTDYPAAPNDEVVVSMNDGTMNQAPIFYQVAVYEGTQMGVGASAGYAITTIAGTQYVIPIYLPS